MGEQNRRVFLFFALVAGWLLITSVVFKPPPKPPGALPGSTPPPAITAGATTRTQQIAQPPALGPPPGSTPIPVPPRAMRDDVEIVTVTTESYEIDFSTLGAVPVRWDIIDPAIVNGADGAEGEPGEAGRIALIDRDLDPDGLDRPFEIVLKEQYKSIYYTELNDEFVYDFERMEDEQSITLIFTSQLTQSGLRLVKRWRIPKQGFVSELTLTLINESEFDLDFNNEDLGLGLSLGPGLGYAPSGKGGFGGFRSPTEVVNKSSNGVEALKLKPGEPSEIFDASEAIGGIDWAGIHNRYFMMSVIPVAGFEMGGRPGAEAAPAQGFRASKARIDMEVQYALLASKDTVAHYPRMEIYSRPFRVPIGGSQEFRYTVFAGPKQHAVLKEVGPGLQGILFYNSWNWMRGLCLMLMSLLRFYHGFLANWGLAIVALVITVRLVTFPLAQKGMKAQAKMMAEQAKIKPYLEKINEKFKDNPQKKQQETMKLYREHNVNPFGMLKGCVWMFIQLPIFFALYRLLSQSIDLRGAPFLWIDDLSKPDQLFAFGFSIPIVGEYFNLLPILMAATQLLVSKLSMNPNTAADPNSAAMQKQMMYMMPVMMLFMLYSFPAGLVLYWMISNVWQLFQQQFVNKKILRPPPPAGAAAAAA